jgi:asparagine synthase (glutamine-hydrolysing)
MCGIAVVCGSGRAAVGEMTRSLLHRGPDAHGSHIEGKCALGHTRLSIIDLTTGAQPMSDVEGRYWISFNGEIYNYPELRGDLSSLGRVFLTQSDTEVLLAGYAEWGPALLDRLRGMFALAIWDAETEELFAARDLFGEKPLYYASSPAGDLVIASEIKAIRAARLVETTINRSAVDAFLMLGYIPPDRTIYSEIETLPPASYLLWRDGKTTVKPYWRPRFEIARISLEDAAERLRELLQQAVRRQMIADVPVGAFLSGGLDSSTIVALTTSHSREPVQTFSVGFGSMINELPYARMVAERYGTDHHEIDLGEPDVATLIQRMTDVYDEPFADSSHIPTYLIAEYARKYVKVVLSGDGGDELFGGYWWYAPLLRSERVPFALLQWAVLRTAGKVFKQRSRALTVRSHAAGLAARWDDVWTRDIMSQTVFRQAHRRRLWGDAGDEFDPGGSFRPDAVVSGLNRAFHFDLTSYLPGDILVKLDRAAMAHGLETRAPFLDRDVVEFALSLPPDLKVRGNDTKVVLKEAAGQYWPRELWNRPKQGFGAPIPRWLELPEMKALQDRVFRTGSPLHHLLPGVREKNHSRDYKTWVLLTLGLWLEKHG